MRRSRERGTSLILDGDSEEPSAGTRPNEAWVGITLGAVLGRSLLPTTVGASLLGRSPLEGISRFPQTFASAEPHTLIFQAAQTNLTPAKAGIHHHHHYKFPTPAINPFIS